MNTLLSNVDTIIEEARDEFGIPGAAVAILHNGEVVHQKGYGFRNLEEKLPVTDDTQFPIGSCTKGFTGHLLNQLAQEGKLSLEDPIAKYLPKVQLADPITIRDVLSHRTGLARNDPLWIINEISQAQLLPLLANFLHVHPFRHAFHYNNIVFSLAGLVVASVTGKTWEENLKERIFVPLDMQRSATSVSSENVAIPYAQGKRVPYRELSFSAPGGGIVSTASDMAKWLLAQKMDETKVSQITVANHRDLHGYGLGWFLGEKNGFQTVSHAGMTDGFTAETLLIPEENFGIAILVNSSDRGSYFIAAVTNALLGDCEALEKAKQAEKEIQKNVRELCPNHKLLDPEEYVGTYTNPLYGKATVTWEKDKLRLVNGPFIMPLHFKGEGCFETELSLLSVYGIPSVVTIELDKKSVKIPYEAFRGLPSVIFTRQ